MGSGRIRLRNSDPNAAPLIECRLLGDEADVETLLKGLLAIREIMEAKPIGGLIEQEVVAGPQVKSVADIRAFIRAETKTTYHPSGTCRMGVDSTAVVDTDLRVIGTDNLWVADASIMPDLISGNTNAVCMLIGKKLGKQLTSR